MNWITASARLSLRRKRVAALLVATVGSWCAIAASANQDAAPIAPIEADGPWTAQYSPEAPAVMLSAGHAKLCRVGVGQRFPQVKLPRLDGDATELASLAGRRATVVLFWSEDRWMSRGALRDLARLEVDETLAPQDLSIVGLFVGEPNDAARRTLAESGAQFPQLVDADGAALAQVGGRHLPRIYVLDAHGAIVWFDIEYSEATRRELRQAIAAAIEAADKR